MTSLNFQKNPVQALITSLTHGHRSIDSSASSSYLILLQHSLQPARQVLWDGGGSGDQQNEEQLYRQAQIRTPAENAMRDATGHLWLQYLCREFCTNSIRNGTASSSTRLVYIQTTSDGHRRLADFQIPSDSVVRILDTSVDPFGWDDTRGDGDAKVAVALLEDLEALTRAIETHVSDAIEEGDATPSTDEDGGQCTVVVVIESISPLLMRHGAPRTFQWLRQLLRSTTNTNALRLRCTVIVPIMVETLSSVQHQALEDIAQAVLSLHQGDMTLIRHGVRDKGNVIREVVPFRLTMVHDEQRHQGRTLQLEVGVEDRGDDDGSVETGKEQSIPQRPSSAFAPATADSDIPLLPHRPGKVALKMEDDSTTEKARAESHATGTGENNQRPRIYMQDNDPEFDDFDEDDPDDDLDI